MVKGGKRGVSSHVGLNDDMVGVGSVNAFKRKLDHHLRNVRGYF